MSEAIERQLSDALGGTMVTQAEILAEVDVTRKFSDWAIKAVRKDSHWKLAWTDDEGRHEGVYNADEGFFITDIGLLDEVDFYAMWEDLPDRKSALIAIGTDPKLWRENRDEEQREATGMENQKGKREKLSPVRVISKLLGDGTLLEALYDPATGTDALAIRKPDGRRPLTFQDLDRLVPDVQWEWDKWLAKGMVGLIVGEVGVGKSSLALSVAGNVVKEAPWPDGSPNKGLGLAVWVETEHAQAIQRERATKWGLPKERLIIPSATGDPLEKIWLDERKGWQAIEREVRRPDVKLLVVDSMRGAYHGDENASDTIEVLSKLAALARDAQISVLVVHHLRKKGMLDGGKIDLDRVRGSSAIVQIPRCVWAIDKPDPLAPQMLRLSQIKNNLVPFPEPLGFQIAESGLIWCDTPTEPKVETQRDRAADLLQVLLRDGPVPSAEIYEEGEHQGISKNTMKRAKELLGVEAIRKEGHWWWQVPEKRVFKLG